MTKSDAAAWLFATQSCWLDANEAYKNLGEPELVEDGAFFLLWHRAIRKYLKIPMGFAGLFRAS